MRSFYVRFLKTICDHSGHEHHTCQGSFLIQAGTLAEAIQQAEKDFCLQKQVKDWTMFADTVELCGPSDSAAGAAAHKRHADHIHAI
ncbi:hypothetical protein [Bradyrhizobium sp. dw_78]|uniref:hypothetical protein n=1 Tax=Bradyrhizobium sp. dw_78 TaxID=2719793 RepID=UPI001BD3EC41|nr:hypothetical protein [Bradyrhizobium sp. dw_78]